MKAQSADLPDIDVPSPTRPRSKPKSVQRRMSPAVRRKQILDQAVQFFSEHGLTAQTRALADACGISQRLLYRYFPTKEALLDEVYRTAILGPFQAVWLVELADRSVPIEQRLSRFYATYLEVIFTRQWLRLFMYASLADVAMAPNYTSTLILQLLQLIVVETAAAQGIDPPEDPHLRHEIAWTMHGALSHYAIRHQIYAFPQHVDVDRIVKIHVAQFLGGFRAAVAAST